MLERGSEQLVVRSEGLYRNLNDIKYVRVATHEGTPVFKVLEKFMKKIWFIVIFILEIYCLVV